MRLYLILFSSVLIFSACENTTVAPNQEILGLQFFPMDFQEGEHYAVEEINYNNDGTVDTLRYFIQDEWTDSLLVDGLTKFEGYRYNISRGGAKKIEASIVKSLSSNLAKFRLGNTEEVKLVFPVAEAKTWNGQPQEFQEDEFSIVGAFQPYQIADSTFMSTLQVVQENNQDSISNFDQRIEVYAANTGLIYKVSSQLEFCRETECLGLQEIEFGKTIRMTRIFNQ